ncbi:MAG TPA: ribose 5-phosphate isomerase B [Firmicutes bacterium]|nr:ribose 5-phosphate isomerase B [Candidatus Fermentithermobacillaceae bacterium]
MKIAIAADHAGFRLKEKIKEYLVSAGYQLEDFGTSGEDPVDYPDFGLSAALAVMNGSCDLGILVCGTGLGMAIAANKIPGIRAVTCNDTFSARSSREHNDANVLCLGARVIGEGLALDIVKVWLNSSFQGGRHERRVNKIREIEGRYFGGRGDGG